MLLIRQTNNKTTTDDYVKTTKPHPHLIWDTFDAHQHHQHSPCPVSLSTHLLNDGHGDNYNRVIIIMYRETRDSRPQSQPASHLVRGLVCDPSFFYIRRRDQSIHQFISIVSGSILKLSRHFEWHGGGVRALLCPQLGNSYPPVPS